MKTKLIVIYLIFLNYSLAEKRYLELFGCDILSNTEAECCGALNFINVPQNDYCINITYNINELTINLNFKINGEIIFNGKIDSTIAPICPPGSLICLTINHVNLQLREICTKLTFGPLTLVKFPCIGILNGQIYTEINSFV